METEITRAKRRSFSYFRATAVVLAAVVYKQMCLRPVPTVCPTAFGVDGRLQDGLGDPLRIEL